MTLIDHRVLVNASPEAIWPLLGDLGALPTWHANCTATSILTTQQTGVGTRRRNTMQRGPAEVEEILSWYNNLGYEYTVVDGPRYRSNRGLVRLQAIPEGTVVQWTFEYELGGLLSGPRDSTTVRRRLDKTIAGSLKQLKKLIESSGARMDTATIKKVALQPKPSVSERAKLAEQETALRQAAKAETIVKMPPLPPDATVEANEQIPEVSSAPGENAGPPPATAGELTAESVPVPIDELPVGDEDTQPRHPAAVEGDAAAKADSAGAEGQPEVHIETSLESRLAAEEPPLSEEDTRPGRTAAGEVEAVDESALAVAPPTPDDESPVPAPAAEEQAPADEETPGPVEVTDAVPATESDTPASSMGESAASGEEGSSEAGQEPDIDEPPVVDTETGDLDDAAPEPEDEVSDVVDRMPPTEAATQEEEPAAERPPESTPSVPDPDPASPMSVFDQDIKPVGPSIWDVFGITPPSEEEADTDSSSS